MPYPRWATLAVVIVLLGLGWFMFDRWGAGRPVNRQDVDRILLILLLVWVAALVRWMLRHWYATGPGPIEITPPSEAPGEEIAAALREALTSVHLNSPSTVPGASAPQDFITDVRTTPSGWGLLVAAFAALLPQRPYRVSLVARIENAVENGPDEQTRYGLTVEVASRLSRDVDVATIWDRSWKAVVDRAACHIAAHVLPRTSLSRRAPWTPWHGIELDPELFWHFNEARRLAAAGRFEEALDYFDRASALDPRNPYIRFEKATILEQLGLYIDALAVYVDVVTMESWHDRRLWNRYRNRFGDHLSGDPRPRWLNRSPNGAAALLLARYRMVGALGASLRLASQWHSRRDRTAAPEPGVQRQGRRQESAERIIARLRPLVTCYGNMMLRWHGIKDTTFTDADQIDGDLQLLRRVLQFAALVEAQDIGRDYSWFRGRRWRRGLPYSQPAVRALLPWAALQYRYVEVVHHRNGQPQNPWIEMLKDRKLPAGRVRQRVVKQEWTWPPSPEVVNDLVQQALRRRFGGRWGWLEHYNAACVFAVGMLTPEQAELGQDVTEQAAADHQALVRHAVRQLELAVVVSDSQFAAGRAPWLRYGDQDLDSLRVTPEYQTFIDRFLPYVAPLSRLPRNVALLTITGHLFQLVERYAKLRKEFWEGNGERKQTLHMPDLREEDMWWDRLREFCRDYRDWPTRRELIRLATDYSPAFDATLPKIEEDRQWANRAWKTRELSPAAESRTLQTRINRWLETSRRLGETAEDLIEHRNNALNSLWDKLLEHIPDRLAVEISPSADDGAPTPPENITAARLAATWRSVEAYMRMLRRGLPEQDQREALEEIGTHLRLLQAGPSIA